MIDHSTVYLYPIIIVGGNCKPWDIYRSKTVKKVNTEEWKSSCYMGNGAPKVSVIAYYAKVEALNSACIFSWEYLIT